MNSDGLCQSSGFYDQLNCDDPTLDGTPSSFSNATDVVDQLWNARLSTCSDTGLADPGNRATQGMFTQSFGNIQDAGEGPNNCFAGYKAVILFCMAARGSPGGQWTNPNDTTRVAVLWIWRRLGLADGFFPPLNSSLIMALALDLCTDGVQKSRLQLQNTLLSLSS